MHVASHDAYVVVHAHCSGFAITRIALRNCTHEVFLRVEDLPVLARTALGLLSTTVVVFSYSSKVFAHLEEIYRLWVAEKAEGMSLVQETESS